MQDDDADDDELLKTLPRTLPPPEALRGRVAAELTRRKLIAPQGVRARGWLRTAAVLLLPMAAFAAGWFAHSGGPPVNTGSERYVLLLYGAAAEPGNDPREGIREYSEWAQGVARAGRRVTGEKLEDAAEVVGASAESPVDPAALRGFFVVDAGDLREARQIAARHPHIRRGGAIVIRRIEPTP